MNRTWSRTDAGRRLGRKARIDPLTGTRSRVALELDLRRLLQRPSGARAAAVVVEVHRLEAINRSSGRAAGDHVLQVIGRRLASVPLIGARYRADGGCFAVLCPSPDATAIAGWVDQAAEALSPPVVLADGRRIDVRCDITAVALVGSGLAGTPPSLVDIVRRSARRAPHPTARHRRRVRVGFTGVDVAADVAYERCVTGALAHHQILARYQPVVALPHGSVVGIEALARWDDGPHGRRQPEDFLPVAEGLGLVCSLTDRLLDQACADLVASGDPSWWVAVNLHPDDVADPDLKARVAGALARSGLPPHRLVLEISERAIPHHEVVASLREAAGLGVRLAIDDFGSGWSSLAQIRSLPITLVKLDRCQLDQRDERSIEVLEASVSLARALGQEIIAEGIEDRDDIERVVACGVELGQGFQWGRARPIEELVPAAPGPSPRWSA